VVIYAYCQYANYKHKVNITQDFFSIHTITEKGVGVVYKQLVHDFFVVFRSDFF
jgi:hypothetical protein